MDRANCDRSVSTIPWNAWMYDLTGTNRASTGVTLADYAVTTKQALATPGTRRESLNSHISATLRLSSNGHHENGEPRIVITYN